MIGIAAFPRLDVRDLQVILALAAAGSTASAAAALHLTQSAVSRALALVEAKLEIRLFERTVRGLVPSPAGTRLIAGAGAVLAQLADLENASRTPRAPRRVRIVCECYTAYRWLPSALARLRGSLPDLEVELELDRIADPVAALVAGELDLALLASASVRRPLREVPVFADEVVFVLAADHPLASQASLTRRDLIRFPFVTSSQLPPAETSRLVAQIVGRKAPTLEHVRLPLTEAILDVVRANHGIAALSEWIASAHLGQGLVAKRLASGPIRRPWRLAFRPEAAAAARVIGEALAGAAPRVHATR